MAEHNHHPSLLEYDGAPLEDSMKIHYFEERIKNPNLDAARNTILVNRMQFPDFDSVMQLYETSKRGQKSENAVSSGRQLSAITGRGGASRGGRGQGDPDARQRGLVSQADIDRVTTVENKHYPKEVYAKFSAAEKAKHWQLRYPEKERGTGSTGGKKSGISATNVSDFASAISSAVSAISAHSDMTKRSAEEDETDDVPSNRKNPALVCQSKKIKSEN